MFCLYVFNYPVSYRWAADDIPVHAALNWVAAGFALVPATVLLVASLRHLPPSRLATRDLAIGAISGAGSLLIGRHLMFADDPLPSTQLTTVALFGTAVVVSAMIGLTGLRRLQAGSALLILELSGAMLLVGALLAGSYAIIWPRHTSMDALAPHARLILAATALGAVTGAILLALTYAAFVQFSL